MSGLELPGDESIVWRYIDVSKYLSMLVTHSIYFVRSDKFKDSWDSVLPFHWREKMNLEMGTKPNGSTFTEAEWYEEREIPSNPISCWNLSDHECQRMWDEYTTGPEAVVVCTTLGRLKSCFSPCDRKVQIGRVHYGDHTQVKAPKFAASYWPDTQTPPTGLNPWYVPRFLKKQEFEFENEIRVSVHVPAELEPISHGYPLEIGVQGLRSLIKSIRVKPGSQDWFVEVMKSVNDKYDLPDVLVEHSELDERRVCENRTMCVSF